MELNFEGDVSNSGGLNSDVAGSSAQSLKQALADHEERVDGLIKAAGRYVASLKLWKKACQTGHLAQRQRSAASAQELVSDLPASTQEVAFSWNFDAKVYLEGDAWRKELQNISALRFGLRTTEDEEALVSPPIIVRAQPGLNRLLLGKTGWPTLHPEFTSAYLKKLNEKIASVAASQVFLNELHEGCKKYRPDDLSIRFGELYGHWSGAPGWKKENSRMSFAQQIYSLKQSGVRTTKDQKTFAIEGPAGKYSKQDVFEVIGDDGKLQQFYSIWFR